MLLGLAGTALLLYVIYFVLVGSFIGWIAGNLMHSDRSFLANAGIGIIGSIIGGLLGGLLGINMGGLLSRLILSVIGACFFIWVLRRQDKKR